MSCSILQPGKVRGVDTRQGFNHARLKVLCDGMRERSEDVPEEEGFGFAIGSAGGRRVHPPEDGTWAVGPVRRVTAYLVSSS